MLSIDQLVRAIHGRFPEYFRVEKDKIGRVVDVHKPYLTLQRLHLNVEIHCRVSFSRFGEGGNES